MSSLLWFIVILLVVLWALGYFVVHLGNLIYLLLVLALIVVVYQLITGRRTL